MTNVLDKVLMTEFSLIGLCLISLIAGAIGGVAGPKNNAWNYFDTLGALSIPATLIMLAALIATMIVRVWV